MDNNLHYLFLRNHVLFAALTEIEIKELYLASEYKSLKKDAVIYSNVQDVHRFYMLIKGRIKIGYCVEDSEEVVFEILKEGDIFGELTLQQSKNTNSAFARVLTNNTSLCSFRLEVFQQILRKHPEISIIYYQILAEKLKTISRKYCDLVFKDVRSRVINFFILHAQYEAEWTGNKAEIKMFCTHQDIADFIASSRQTVSTIINDLIKDKIISYEGRNKLIIPDIKKLKI